MRWVAFDFDDVLVNSRPIVEEAYRMAGVRDEARPDGWYGTPGMDWLVPTFGQELAERIYAAKHRHYAVLMPGVVELPAMWLAKRLRGVMVVTAAQGGVVRELLDRSGWRPDRLFTDCTREGKIYALRDAGAGVYVDDLEAGRDIAAAAGGWNFVHYRGQQLSELAKEIFRCL